MFNVVFRGLLALLAASYDKLITEPLRLFYFVGPWWGNAPTTEICYELTGVKASWWAENDDRMAECAALLERHFVSWDVTIMTVLYVTTLTFLLVNLMCSCLVVRPIVRAIEKYDNPKRSYIASEREKDG